MSELTTEELLNKIGQPDPTDEQPRDENGRFASPQEEAEVEQEETVEPEVDAQADLRQQIADLKEMVANLSQQSQPKTPKREVKKLTADDEFRLSQDLSMTPTKAMREWFESEMGMTIEDFRERQEAAQEAVETKRSYDASWKFLNAHPEYVRSNKNDNRITSYMAKLRLDTKDPKSYETAYKDLMEDELLETDSTAKAAAPKPVVTKKAVPGLKTRGGTSAPSSATSSLADEEKKMREMPIDQMLAYMANKVSKK